MKFIYKDLLNHLSKKPSKELLSEKLFQLGHEHEIHGDIFDMELTPNRGDCLSLVGLARDLNIFFGRSEAISIFKDNIQTLEIDFENLSASACPQISFLEIEIEEITSEYKPYLQNYFSSLGNNKTNLFTDISNYISYELGQPTHCFDAEAINGKLIFEYKKSKGKFKTLLGNKIELTDKNCVFSINDEIVSLAGVMGGESTSCSTQTKKVLVECAYFKPELIIGKSIKYNLISDASHRFERGVDITSQEYVLRRFIKLVQDHAKIKTLKLNSFTAEEFEHHSIPIDTDRINRILGTQISKSVYLNYLTALEFKVDTAIKVPSHRHDIKTHNDLAEEIARVIGYNNIPSIPLNLNNFTKKIKESKIIKIETFLIQHGFQEVINFPFTSSEDSKSISIDNPLDSNRKNFRTCTKDSLVENLLYNERRQNDSIKIFEISDIYKKDPAIKQQKKLGIIISGRLGNNYQDFSKKLDYEYLNNLLNGSLINEDFKIIEISRDNLDTKRKDKIFYVEIPLEDIPEQFFSNITNNEKLINFISYVPVSEFPSSTRDFSFSIVDSDLVSVIIDRMKSISDPMVKNVFIFDFYKNSKTDTVKLGYRLVFQSHQKTLSEKEINSKVKEIINPVIAMKGVSIPGMN